MDKKLVEELISELRGIKWALFFIEGALVMAVTHFMLTK